MQSWLVFQQSEQTPFTTCLSSVSQHGIRIAKFCTNTFLVLSLVVNSTVYYTTRLQYISYDPSVVHQLWSFSAVHQLWSFSGIFLGFYYNRSAGYSTTYVYCACAHTSPCPYQSMPIPAHTHTSPYPYQPMPIPAHAHTSPYPYQPIPIPAHAHTSPYPYQPMPIPAHTHTSPCPYQVAIYTQSWDQELLSCLLRHLIVVHYLTTTSLCVHP